MKKIFVFLFVLAVIIFIVLSIYLFVLNKEVEKPFLENPSIGENFSDYDSITLNKDYFIFILNEIEFYKAHNSPMNGEIPLVLVWISDTNQTFNFSVKNGEIIYLEKNNINPDLGIVTNKETVIKIIKSRDIIQEVKNNFNIGTFYAKLMKDEKTLALKGYLPIYQKFMS